VAQLVHGYVFYNYGRAAGKQATVYSKWSLHVYGTIYPKPGYKYTFPRQLKYEVVEVFTAHGKTGSEWSEVVVGNKLASFPHCRFSQGTTELCVERALRECEIGIPRGRKSLAVCGCCTCSL